MKKINYLIIAVCMLFATVSLAQGVTNSGLTGRVLDNTGEPLPGANIVAVHQPTGTQYGASTDFDGYFRISNMRPGGPYSLAISYVSFQTFEESNFSLPLGDTRNVNVTLEESSNALEEVVITTPGTIFNSDVTGSETNVSQRQISTLPSVSRSIADFARITPEALITEGNDGFSISLAGQNNRYNAIYIDGAVNNDVFGLAGSGTNGGQTGVNPFSVDAIETFQINLAPFDVRQSGFSGGSINAITRSGSNNWEGSVYTFYRNEKLAGKTPPILVGEDEERERLDEFSAKTYGFRVGGPIVEDKLFFFVNYERQKDETPQPFNFSNYQGRANQGDINDLVDFLQNTYNYNPGGFDSNTRFLESDKLTAKIDWNINPNNTMSLRHSYVGADNLEARNSNGRNISFINGSELFETITNSTALELNTRFGNKYSNNLIVSYTSVRDDRDPSGSPFPTVDIQDGGGTISFGSEPFSTANLLDQDVFTFNDNFEIYSGAHTITLGTNIEYAFSKNLFFAFNYGDYTFEDQFDEEGQLVSSGLNQFLTNQNADVYQRGYSLVGDGTSGDESAGAAEFSTIQAGVYVQDEYRFSPSFKITGGIRIDVPYWEDGTENPDFNNRTVPILEAAGKDFQGARVGKGINPSIHWAPRLGFNWDVNNASVTQIRGGIGVFTSRLPLVWPGGTYNNNGITSGFNFIRDEIPFNPDINDQFADPLPGTGETGGNVDLIAEDFKLPQVTKINLGIDQKLNIWGLVASGDFIYTDVIQDIYYENLNIGDPVGNLVGVDNRPFYSTQGIDGTYRGVYLLSNTSEGYSYNASATLRKPFENGFQGSISYSYGDSFKIFDGTSSQNSSQWRNIESVNGKNSDLDLRRSNFSLGSRISSNASYEINWTENLQTTIGLFYEGLQGRPYSFTYNEGRDLLGDDSRDNALIYIPASRDEINLVDIVDRDGNVIRAADQQYQDLEQFINNNEYLRERRGEYAESNGDRGPWSHVIDLKLLQDFSIKIGQKNHTLQASLDIFNFTNFVNKDWGVREFIPGQVRPLTTVSAGPEPAFTFDQRRFEDGLGIINDRGLQSSRWQMQFGLRYLFN